MAHGWLFISFHTGGLTPSDPSEDQSAESYDLPPFATALITFDGFCFASGAVKRGPAVARLKQGAAARPLQVLLFTPFPSCPHVKHIKLNVPANLAQLFVCRRGVRTCVFMWRPF